MKKSVWDALKGKSDGNLTFDCRAFYSRVLVKNAAGCFPGLKARFNAKPFRIVVVNRTIDPAECATVSREVFAAALWTAKKSGADEREAFDGINSIVFHYDHAEPSAR